MDELNHGDAVELVSGVTLTRSGQRFPREIAEAWQRDGERLKDVRPAHEPTGTR